jgi:hypothetical protein
LETFTGEMPVWLGKTQPRWKRLGSARRIARTVLLSWT